MFETRTRRKRCRWRKMSVSQQEGLLHVVVVALVALAALIPLGESLEGTEGCDPILKRVDLPKGCRLNRPQNVDNKSTTTATIQDKPHPTVTSSVLKGVCSMALCTDSLSNDCSSSSSENLCCCRPEQVEELDIQCPATDTDAGITLDPTLLRNETKCSCSPCNDVVIKVQLWVKGRSGASGGGAPEPIAAAQIFNMATEEVIGLTLYNGALDFDITFTSKSLKLLIQATGYQRLTRIVPLSPRQQTMVVNVTMTKLIVARIGRGDTEIAYPLGGRVWLHANPGTFHKNGTPHHHDVVFKGSYIDPSTPEALAGIENRHFEVDGTLFGMVASVFLEFEDEEGERLDVKNLSLAVPLAGEEEENMADMFVAAHDWESGRWTRSTSFAPTRTSRGKRATISEIIAVAPDITTQQFLMIATPVRVDCWIQVRTFDSGNAPYPGPLVRLEQRRIVAGMDILYSFGTDTGGAQTLNESFAANAVCLPLDCNAFINVTLMASVEPSTNLSPVPFPPNTFPANSPAEPEIRDTSFFFTAIDPADMLGTLSPSYVFRQHCVDQALEPNGVADPRDYFSFSTDYVQFVPNQDQCYVKITAANCFFRENIPSLVTRDAQSGAVTSSAMFPQLLLGVPLVGSGFPEACLEYKSSCPSMCSEPQPICLPFRCGDILEVTVRSNLTVAPGNTQECAVTTVSPILGDTILALRSSGSSSNTLTIDTSVLDPDSFNDPELGLYFDPQPTRALRLCNGGGTTRDYARLGGSAAEFGCFTD